MKNCLQLLSFIFIFLIPSINFAQEYPTTEIRAVWLTTSWGLDWPTQARTVFQQKQELCDMLDEFKRLNFNVVFFQSRARGTTFYNSKIEPKDSFFNHEGGFDPLAFAVEECHKRGLECHAWIVTFPMKMEKRIVPKKRQLALSKMYPDNYKLINNRQWYLDPGNPRTKDLILMLTKEIVSNYDIDGIHYDHMRYPNNDRTFPDNDTFQKYGQAMDLYDWRRSNINNLVSSIYDLVKSIKPFVQVSSSPLGKYRPLALEMKDGWTAYETVFQDPVEWLKRGKHDLLFPMMYYRDKQFEPFLDDWLLNSNQRPIAAGLGAYQMMKSEKNWPLIDITSQMRYTRSRKVAGQSYFRATNVIQNMKGLKDSIQVFYKYKAKLPPLKWLDKVAPNSPINVQVGRQQDGRLRIAWESPDSAEVFTYTVYYSANEWVNMDDPKFILTTGIRDNSATFSINTGNYGFYYSVTASDRYHNESVPAFSAFFSHSLDEQ